MHICRNYILQLLAVASLQPANQYYVIVHIRGERSGAHNSWEVNMEIDKTSESYQNNAEKFSNIGKKLLNWQ